MDANKTETGDYRKQAGPISVAHPGELQKQVRRIKIQDEEEMLTKRVDREEAIPFKAQEHAHSRKIMMEEVVSPNNMGEINPLDKKKYC